MAFCCLCCVSASLAITSYVRLLLLFVCFDLGCWYPGQSSGGLQLKLCFLIAVSYILCYSYVWNRVEHGIWPNFTQYLWIICSWPFFILLINGRYRYRGDSPNLRQNCLLGLFQRHHIDKNALVSTYWSFIKPNPCFVGFTCSRWIYQSSLSGYEEHTYKTFPSLKW